MIVDFRLPICGSATAFSGNAQISPVLNRPANPTTYWQQSGCVKMQAHSGVLQGGLRGANHEGDEEHKLAPLKSAIGAQKSAIFSLSTKSTAAGFSHSELKGCAA